MSKDGPGTREKDRRERSHLVSTLVDAPDIGNGSSGVGHGCRGGETGEQAEDDEDLDVGCDGARDSEDEEEEDGDEVDDSATVHCASVLAIAQGRKREGLTL